MDRSWVLVIAGIKKFDQPTDSFTVPLIEAELTLGGLTPSTGDSIFEWLGLCDKDVFVDIEALFSTLGGELEYFGAGESGVWKYVRTALIGRR